MTKKRFVSFAYIRYLIGVIFNFLKLHRQTISSKTKCSQNRAGSALALNEQGYTLLRQNNLAEAENLFRHALTINPSSQQAKSNLGQVLRLTGRLSEAELILRDAIRTKTDDALIYNRLATTLRELGKDDEAEFYFREGLKLNPKDADIMNSLGGLLNQSGKLIEAAHYFEAAISADPTHEIAKCNLCANLSDRGLHEEADKCFIEAIALKPDYYYPRISYVMNKLHIIYEDIFSVNKSRAQYAEALLALRDWLLVQNSTLLDSAAEMVGWVSPFYLTYQGQNNKELQGIYGDLICKLMAHRYPELSVLPSMPPTTKDIPLRIGIVSAFFYDHSNWKTPIRGWLEHIDKSRFSLFGYYTGAEQDEVTETAKRLCYRFTEGFSFEALARQIKNDGLHAIIFPEISMDPTTTKLAALRLAPIQCNSWGHPDTSGMPTIDYYLSSTLMEPEDGQTYYTEKLICLPNLSICYTPPTYSPLPLTRKNLNLDDEKILYCCAQSLFKYLPQFDCLFINIAKRMNNVQFIFFGNQKSSDVDKIFIHRLSTAFEKENLAPEKYIALLPRLDRNHFQTVLNLCDVYLDSMEWSGCNTTLEAFLCDIPVITYKGSMMRGRHTYAFLKMMGLDELIATNLEEYVDLAISLGNDPLKRQQIRDNIKTNFHRICGDISCVHALEDFLVTAIHGHHKT